MLTSAEQTWYYYYTYGKDGKRLKSLVSWLPYSVIFAVLMMSRSSSYGKRKSAQRFTYKLNSPLYQGVGCQSLRTRFVPAQKPYEPFLINGCSLSDHVALPCGKLRQSCCFAIRDQVSPTHNCQRSGVDKLPHSILWISVLANVRQVFSSSNDSIIHQLEQLTTSAVVQL
jgi:hypothetical protein